MSMYGVEPERLTVPVSKHDHIRGRIDAPMTLVEYGDYECPYCSAACPLTEALIDTLGDDLCFTYRHFPMVTMHPHAGRAAEAAEAAGAQKRFWEMHAMLFQNQDALEDEDLVRYAASLQLSMKRFTEDLSTNAYAGKVRDNFRSGIQSGVNGTPSFFVNGVRYDGPRDLESMIAALNQ